MSSTTRRLVIVLSVSLALNLFFAGFLVARAAFGRRGPRGPQDMHEPFAAMMGGEPGGDDDLARKIMHRHRDALSSERKGLREARRETVEALVAEPFARERLERALEQTRVHTAASQRAMHDALVEYAEGLDPEQRRRFARRALRRESEHREHGRGRPGETPGPERRKGMTGSRDRH